MRLRQERKAPDQFTPDSDIINPDSSRAKRLRANETLEVQKTRCTTPAYSSLPPCVPCSKHRHGEHCRFRKMRLVARSAAGGVRSLASFRSGAGFSISTFAAADGGSSLAERKDAAFVLEHACRPFVEAVDAELLLLPPDAELAVATAQLAAASADPNADYKAALDRSHLEGERQLCDACGTTIMCLYQACVHCGYEACLACTSAYARRASNALLRCCAAALLRLLRLLRCCATALLRCCAAPPLLRSAAALLRCSDAVSAPAQPMLHAC